MNLYIINFSLLQKLIFLFLSLSGGLSSIEGKEVGEDRDKVKGLHSKTSLNENSNGNERKHWK